MSSIKVNLGPLEKFGESFKARASEVIRSTAFLIQYEAQGRAPVDTGALRASIYVQTSEKDERPTALVDAEAKYQSPGKSGEFRFREMPIAPETTQPDDRLHSIVAAGVGYAYWVEYGSRGGSGKPFMTPAMAAAKPYFNSELAKAVREAGRDSGFK